MIQWHHYFTILEAGLISIFGIALILYVWRIWTLAKQLKYKKRKVFIKLPLRVIYFTLLIFALLGPSFGYGKKFIETVGKDIYIAIDLSQSMNTQDVQPSRLDKLKYELKKLISILDGERIGLIIFSADAFLQSPLTYDQSALDLFLQTIQTNLVPNKGTDFYPPLKMALDRLTEDEEKNPQHFKSKIVILASDGEDFSGDTPEIIAQYQRAGVRLFTLGVGTEAGGRIPTRNGYKLDPSGKVVKSRLESKSMQQIAEDTGGAFFRISDKQNELALLINTIKSIKGRKIDTRAIDVSYNKYEYFVWIALLLIAIDFIFVVKVLKI